jgi:hypothetical protein
MPRKATPAPKSPWPLILLITAPVLLFFAIVGFVLLRGGGIDMEAGRAELREREARIAAVASALGPDVSVSNVRPGVAEITLPTVQAVTITPVEARELALSARSRLGGIVRVQSPAGQVLAEVP